MKFLILAIMVFSYMSFANPEGSVVSVDGELFKNLKIELTSEKKKFDKEQVAFALAKKECQKLGFKDTLAFYYETKIKKSFLTDVFCTNEEWNSLKQNLARVAIMKDRKERGASLSPSALKRLSRYSMTTIKGFKTTDVSLTSGTPGGPTTQQVPQGQR